MRRAELKNFSVTVEVDIYKRFSKQCIDRGHKKYRALTGALKLWLSLSPAKQSELIDTDTTPESSVPSDNEIYADISHLADLFRDIDTKIRKSETAKRKDTRHRQRRVSD